jgi:hypothetical protein
MKKSIIFTLFFLLCMVRLSAQSNTGAVGGEATGSGGSASYSIGQLFYTTHSGSNGSVEQGIQQAYEIVALSNPEFTAVALSIRTYPNPTTDQIVLAVNDLTLTDLSYELYDGIGRTIANAKVNQSETTIGMQNLAAGVYILKVNQKNAELKTFKIIKN